LAIGWAGSVSTITSGNAVGANITIGANVDGVAFSPDRSIALASSQSNGSVSIIDASSNSITATISGIPAAEDVGSEYTPELREKEKILCDKIATTR
jgi:DNA-binding beta-propeller fold protein YncE